MIISRRSRDSTVSGTTTTNTAFTYGYDVHGDVSVLVNQADGSVKASYGYTPYGASDTTLSKGDTAVNSPFNPYRYAAKRLDSGSKTYDMGVRRFDPSAERFLQLDQFQGALADLALATDPLTQNRYDLGASNPLSGIEWAGHMLVGLDGGYYRSSPNPAGSGGTSPAGSGNGASAPQPSLGIAGMVTPCPIVALICAGFLNGSGTGSSRSTTPGGRGPGGIAVPLPGQVPEGITKGLAGIFTLAALAAAAAAASKFFNEHRSNSCLSGGSNWATNGPLDAEGRATSGMACITSGSTDPGGTPRPLPGYDPATMNLAHLVPAAFGGTARPDNIVLLWEQANKGWDMDPSTGFSGMRRVENQIERAVSPDSNVLYYAQAIYSPFQGTGPGGTPYMPLEIYIRWQASYGPEHQAYVQNVP